MDIEAVNSTLNKAIMSLQEREIEGKSWYYIRKPSAFGFKDYQSSNPANNPDAEDETKSQVSKSIHSWEKYRMGGPIKPAKKKLNKSQQAVMKKIGKGMDLSYISNVLLFDDEFRHWKKNEKKALLSLAMAGKIKVWRVPGPLPGEHRPSRVGARENNHFRIVPSGR